MRTITDNDIKIELADYMALVREGCPYLADATDTLRDLAAAATYETYNGNLADNMEAFIVSCYR